MDRLRRSMLFMPGNNPGMLQNAGVYGADSVIIDLEDAVSIDEKDSARILVRNAIKNVNFYDTEVVVRVNTLFSRFGYSDVDEIARAKPHAIMIPKASEEGVKAICDALSKVETEEGFEKGSIKLVVLIETAYGLENVYKIIKSSTRVEAVMLGAEDLTADLGIKRTKAGEEIFYARCKMVTACKASGIDVIDTPFTDMDDSEAFLADIKKAKSLGMTGKAAINPRQIDVIHDVFSPTEEEILHAQRVIEAMNKAKKEGLGVFSLDGKMVDAPIIARAKTVIKNAMQMGLM